MRRLRRIAPARAVLLFSALAASALASGPPPAADTAPALPAATPGRASTDSCAGLIAALPAGRNDAGPYLDAAACLRRADSAAARKRMPLERALAEGRLAPADSLLAARAPHERAWLMSWMERLRTRRDPARVLDMLRLAEAVLLADGPAGKPGDAIAWREAAALYQSLPDPDPFHAALALLRQAELDTAQATYAQYQIANVLRAAATDAPVEGLLDSLAAAYRHRTPRTAEMLETLAWGERGYRAAFRSLLARMKLGGIDPAAVLDRADRFRTLGYSDFAQAVLDAAHWRDFPQPWRARARSAALRIRFQAQDWAGLLSEAGGDETGKPRNAAEGGEEACYVAAALLHLGRAQEARELLRGPAARAPSPWGFQARLLAAQAEMALSRPREAERLLSALKRDPARREGSGPILFWQACLALDEARFEAADSLLVLASAYAGSEESQRALDYRFFLLLDTAQAARRAFFQGLPEAPRNGGERSRNLDRVPGSSPLWPFARLEKAQILAAQGEGDSALAVLDSVARKSPLRLAGYEAEARAAFLEEKMPNGRQAALARYENLLIQYQRGVIPEFSRGRIEALERRTP